MKPRRHLASLAIMAAVWAIATGFTAAQESKPQSPAAQESKPQSPAAQESKPQSPAAQESKPQAPATAPAASAAKAPEKLESLSAAELSRLIREFSEENGYFRSDNFTSNETAYLTVVDTLRRLGASGGAYLGVGPEQNFTYIAKIRPRIAFIVDIRRQAMIQHLMYKAIFH